MKQLLADFRRTGCAPGLLLALAILGCAAAGCLMQQPR